MSSDNNINDVLEELSEECCRPLDLLSQEELVEKLIELDVSGVPEGPDVLTGGLASLAAQLATINTENLEVVVFGGGTGLSNVIGGDSRNPAWPKDPFHGVKSLFPNTRSIVCVTDDGGSTGEMLKDFPLIALGDLRHVLLSAVQRERLADQYGLGHGEAVMAAGVLHGLFNHRFSSRPDSLDSLLEKAGVELSLLPDEMADGLKRLLEFIFTDERFITPLTRPHCLGNLLLAATIYIGVVPGEDVSCKQLVKGLKELAELIGAFPEAVLPCTTTPANFKAIYANGVLVTGENRSSRARRGFPLDRVFVEFAEKPHVPNEVLEAIARAGIIIFAPGSLYSSIIPIMQVPGLADAVRDNTSALKILVTNLWVQKGETDLVRENPRRRFYVSDLIQAYHRNIPGGLKGLFETMLVLGLHDIPGSVLQGYALEDKIPIFLDKNRVRQMGFNPFEARIFSRRDLLERGVIQHDSNALAKALRTIWAARAYIPHRRKSSLPVAYALESPVVRQDKKTPDQRIASMSPLLEKMTMEDKVRLAVLHILWRYWDIPETHLGCLNGIELVDAGQWPRSQKWDNIASFYDPETRCIKMKEEIFQRPYRFEFSFLVGLGQSLLGNYAIRKEVLPVENNGESLGSMYRLRLRSIDKRQCFLSEKELDHFLFLARMRPSTNDPTLFTRLVNSDEGFTPPGLFFGLTYAWYLDNRFSNHIEYKMSVSRMSGSGVIPYHAKTVHRRREIIDFFRRIVFCYTDPAYDEKQMEVE